MRSHDALTLSGRELAGPLRGFNTVWPLALLTPHPVSAYLTVSRYEETFGFRTRCPDRFNLNYWAPHTRRDTTVPDSILLLGVILLVNISTTLVLYLTCQTCHRFNQGSSCFGTALNRVSRCQKHATEAKVLATRKMTSMLVTMMFRTRNVFTGLRK